MTDLTTEIVECLENHADYDLPEDGFTLPEFVDWVMEGIGDDMVRCDGHNRADVIAAAKQAYNLMSPRFRL
jgi:hypothetical protein